MTTRPKDIKLLIRSWVITGETIRKADKGVRHYKRHFAQTSQEKEECNEIHGLLERAGHLMTVVGVRGSNRERERRQRQPSKS